MIECIRTVLFSFHGPAVETASVLQMSMNGSYYSILRYAVIQRFLVNIRRLAP